MKDSLLLLMTPNMSLEKWNELGQLSREIGYYKDLCQQADLKLTIYSYGRNDSRFTTSFPEITVLGMPSWIPERIPFKLQNLIYYVSSLVYYRKDFKRVLISKTNQFAAFEFGLLLKLFFKMPLVIRMGFYHSHFLGLPLRLKIREWLAFRLSDSILTTSPEAAAFIRQKYRVQAKKMLTMCNSIDLSKFKKIDREKDFDIIFVGRLEPGKNIDLLIEVATSMKLKTLIIGKGSLAGTMKNAVSNFNHIVWKERVDNVDLPDYYNRAKCFVLLSDHEGNSKVLLEAMACGLPCVVTNVPGIRECIDHGINGLFVEKNINCIKAQIESVCRDELKARSIGQNASQWVSDHCSYTENIKKESNFFTSVL